MKQKSKIIEVNDWRDQGRSWWTAESRAMAWKYWYLMPLSLFWGPLPQQLVLRLQLGLRKSQKPGQKDGENIMFFFFFSELSKIYDAKVGGPELEVWHYGGCLESPDPPRSDCWPCPRNKGKKLNRKKKKYWDTRKNISGFVDSTLEISALSQLMFLVEEVKAFLEATWVYGRARLETVLWPHGGS